MIDLNIKKHLPADFTPESKVWIYQSSRLFLLSEVFEIEKMLKEFLAGWNSHGAPVKGYANLFFGRFIVLMADERATGVSGCSTDSSVRLIKAIESTFRVDMFNRQMLCFIVKDKIEIIPMPQLPHALTNGFISEDSLYFNNTVLTKQELEDSWIIPLKNSWLSRYLPSAKA
jgi:hypothetical protein